MRKITIATCSAFEAKRVFKLDNTEVVVLGDETTKSEIVTLLLHGNPIAKCFYTDGDLVSFNITNAGWQSNTTKERLNGLNGVGIYQKKGQWYLNGKEWNGEWVNVAKWDAELEETDFVKNS
jgi:hypothetical protein